MSVDLRKCKPGDKLQTRHGTVMEYVELETSNRSYPHIVKYPNGARGTRTDDGFVFRVNRHPDDEDIVEIMK